MTCVCIALAQAPKSTEATTATLVVLIHARMHTETPSHSQMRSVWYCLPISLGIATSTLYPPPLSGM